MYENKFVNYISPAKMLKFLKSSQKWSSWRHGQLHLFTACFDRCWSLSGNTEYKTKGVTWWWTACVEAVGDTMWSADCRNVRNFFVIFSHNATTCHQGIPQTMFLL